jgi:hypothetical protein
MASHHHLIAGLGSSLASTLPGSVTVATVPVVTTSAVPMSGIAGWLGFTTTVTTTASAPVTVPLAAATLLGIAVTYGAVTLYRAMQQTQPETDSDSPIP